LLAVFAVLLLPYLLAPLYRAGHPVSTLMAWRWATGAPVSRQWIDFGTISSSLPRSVVGSEDARFCSHHGIDWGALREVIDDAEDGEAARGGSTITQQVVKNLFLWPGRSMVRKALELPLSLGPPASSARKPAPSMPSAIRRPACRRAKRRFWRLFCPIRSGAAPATPAPACAGWPGPTRSGHRPRNCSGAGAKIAVFEPFWRILNLALGHSILYKRGLIGICARAKTLQPSAFGRCLRQHP
jgi:hypothetical protein